MAHGRSHINRTPRVSRQQQIRSKYENRIMRDAPVGYWRLDEASGTIANNLGSVGVDGTYQNTPTLGVAGPLVGDSNTAVDFDDTASENISVPDSSAYSAVGFNLTVEAWVKPASITSVDTIVCKLNGDVPEWEFELASGYLQFGTWKSDFTSYVFTNVSPALTVGTWYHVAAVVDTTLASDHADYIKLYIDGQNVPVNTPAYGGTQPFSMTAGTATVEIGGTTGQFFDGSIDEVAIWNSKLTDAQIANHYRASGLAFKGGGYIYGSGTVSSSGTRVVSGSAAITGSGTVSATGAHTSLASAALTGTGTVSATGAHTSLASAALTGSGAVSATGVKTRLGSASITGSGTVAATGAKVHSGSVSLTGSGTVSATGNEIVITNIFEFGFDNTDGFTTSEFEVVEDRFYLISINNEILASPPAEQPTPSSSGGETFTLVESLLTGGAGYTRLTLWWFRALATTTIDLSFDFDGQNQYSVSGLVNMVAGENPTDTIIQFDSDIFAANPYVAGLDNDLGNVRNAAYGVGFFAVAANQVTSTSGAIEVREVSGYSGFTLTTAYKINSQSVSWDQGTAFDAQSIVVEIRALDAISEYGGESAITGSGTVSSSGTVTKLGSAALTGSGTVSASGTYIRATGAAITGTGTISATGPVSAYEALILSDTPISYWRLGEPSGINANDIGSLGNDGTYTNTPTLAVAGALVDDADTAVDFNGTDENVRAPDNAAYTPAGGSKLSVEAWFNHDTGSGNGGIVSKLGGDWEYSLGYASGGVFAEAYEATAGAYTGFFVEASFGSWHHAVMVIDTAVASDVAGFVTLYLDGQLVGGSATVDGDQPFTITNGDGTVDIGGSTQNGGPWFDGKIDEVAIYDYALDATQVFNHYSTGIGSVVYEGEANLTGSGAVSATGVRTALGTAALTGSGTVSASGAYTRATGAAVSGSGAVSASGVVSDLGTAALTGSGTVSASGTYIRATGAAVTGSGTVSTTGVRTAYGAATLTGTGTLAASAATLGAAALTGTGTVSATGFTEAIATAALTGSGTVSTTGFKSTEGSADLTGTGTISATASASGAFEGEADLTGSGAISATGVKTRLGQVALTGSGELSVSGATGNVAVLYGTGAVSATAFAERMASAAVTGTGVLEPDWAEQVSDTDTATSTDEEALTLAGTDATAAILEEFSIAADLDNDDAGAGTDLDQPFDSETIHLPTYLHWTGGYIGIDQQVPFVSVDEYPTVNPFGDQDIRIFIRPKTWGPLDEQALVSYGFRDFSLGENQLVYEWIDNETEELHRFTSTGIFFGDEQQKWVRVTHLLDNGSSQSEIQFFTSEDGVDWIALDAPTVDEGVATYVPDVSEVQIARHSFDQKVYLGDVFYVEARDGIDGAVALRGDFRTMQYQRDDFVFADPASPYYFNWHLFPSDQWSMVLKGGEWSVEIGQEAADTGAVAIIEQQFLDVSTDESVSIAETWLIGADSAEDETSETTDEHVLTLAGAEAVTGLDEHVLTVSVSDTENAAIFDSDDFQETDAAVSNAEEGALAGEDEFLELDTAETATGVDDSYVSVADVEEGALSGEEEVLDAAIVDSESLSGDETSVLTVDLSSDESAIGIETEAFTFEETETGSGTDAETIAVASSDISVATVETGTVDAAVVGTDTATDDEAGAIALAFTESGLGVETETLTVSVSGQETGQESSQENIALTGSDTASDTEVGTITEASFSSEDSALGTETETTTATLPGTDTGSGADEEAATFIVGADTATGTEAATIAVAADETASDTETEALNVTTEDAATGVDAGEFRPVEVTTVPVVTTVGSPGISIEVSVSTVEATTSIDTPVVSDADVAQAPELPVIVTVDAPGISASFTVTTVQAVTSIDTPVALAVAEVPAVTVSVPATVGAPGISISLTPATVAVAVSVGAPGITIDQGVSTVPVVATVGAPTISIDFTKSLAQIFVFTSIDTPTIVELLEINTTTVPVPVAVGAPVLSTSWVVEPTTVAVTVTVGAPDVLTNIRPDGIVATTSVDTPAISTGFTVFPSTVAVVATVGAPVVSDSEDTLVSTVPVPVTVGAPGISIAVTATTVSCAATVDTPTIAYGYTITPATVSAISSIDAPTFVADYIFTPLTVAVVASTPAPLITLHMTVLALAVDVPVTILAPVLFNNAIVTPIAVAATTSIPIPIIQAGTAVVFAETVAVAVSVGIPAIASEFGVGVLTVEASTSVATPGIGVAIGVTTIEAVATVPEPSISLNTVPFSDPIPVSVSVPTPTVFEEKIISPATIVLSTTIPQIVMEMAVPAETVIAQVTDIGINAIARPVLSTEIFVENLTDQGKSMSFNILGQGARTRSTEILIGGGETDTEGIDMVIEF